MPAMRSKPLTLILLILRAMVVVAWRRLTRQPGSTVQKFRVQVLLEILRRDLERMIEIPPHVVRRLERPTPMLPSIRRQVHMETIDVAGVSTLDIRPQGWQDGGPTLLYFHGGGYCVCSPKTHRVLGAQLALAGGVRCLMPDYRLAPEHPYPAAIDDAMAVYRQLLADGVDSEHLNLGGDSAGGGLTLACMLRLRDDGEPLPRRAILLSPWADLTLSGGSITSNASTDYLSRPVLEWFANNYVGDHDPRNPEISSLHADLGGLPPTLVQVGGAEVFLDEVKALAERLKTAGVAAELQVFPAAAHVFQAFGPVTPEAKVAVDRLGEFLR